MKKPSPKGGGFARRVTKATLLTYRRFLKDLLVTAPEDIPDEDEQHDSASERQLKGREENDNFSDPFKGGNSLPKVRVQSYSKGPSRGGSRASRAVKISTKAEAFNASHLGELVWRKPEVDASSVNRQPGNPTNELRLTQAKFKSNSAIIDHRTYFRNALFGHGQWRRVREDPFIEEASFSFRLVVREVDWGVHDITVSHKPSGEAGQGNYPTSLKWGELGDRIYEANLTGLTADLFKSVDDSSEFVLVFS